MLQNVDTAAHLNRWRTRSGPVALFCAGMMLCAFLPPVRFAAPLAGFVAAGAALVGARVPLATFLRAIVVPSGFIAIGSAILCVSLGSRADHAWVRIDPEGFSLAVDTSLRSLGAVSVLVSFACTVPTSRWIAWLQAARLPHAVIDLLHLTYRTIFLLDEQRQLLTRAAANRLGARSAVSRLRGGAHIGAGLFVRTLDRAHRLERGLAARGYSDSLAVLQPATTTRGIDYAFALIPSVVVAGLVLALGHLP